MRRDAGFGWAVVLLLFAMPVGAEVPPIDVHGQIDLTLSSRGDGLTENLYNLGSSNFDPYNVRLFFDSEVGDGFQVFAQLSLSEIAGIETHGAYVVWTPRPGQDLHVEAGKIPSPVGTWAPRTYSDKNPLIGIPLMFQYHTSLLVNQVPPDADALLGAAGQGQIGPDYGTGPTWKGMPVVYDRCWDFGAVVMGSAHQIEFALGSTYGTPSAGVSGPDWNGGKTVLGRIGAAPWPWLRAGVSGAWGPYLPDFVKSFTPSLTGKDVDDFNQKLVMGDLEVEWGHLEFHGEGYHNTWETPTVGDLDVSGGYAEGKATVAPGWYVAARWEAMRFGELAGATIAKQPWDHDRDRWEAGAGYRVGRNALLKAVFQRNVEKIPAQDDQTRDITALQLNLNF